MIKVIGEKARVYTKYMGYEDVTEYKILSVCKSIVKQNGEIKEDDDTLVYLGECKYSGGIRHDLLKPNLVPGPGGDLILNWDYYDNRLIIDKSKTDIFPERVEYGIRIDWPVEQKQTPVFKSAHHKYDSINRSLIVYDEFGKEIYSISEKDIKGIKNV